MKLKEIKVEDGGVLEGQCVMESKRTPYDLHVLICTNRREGRASCGESGGDELKNNTKRLCRESAKLAGVKVRVNTSGCLGLCEEGIVAMVYPTGQCFSHLQEGDAETLVQEVEKLAKGNKTEVL